jgi:hypothetical protein
MTAAIFSDPQALGIYRSADIVIGFGVFAAMMSWYPLRPSPDLIDTVVFPDFGVSALTFAVSNATNANVSRIVGMIERIALLPFLIKYKIIYLKHPTQKYAVGEMIFPSMLFAKFFSIDYPTRR